MRQLKPLTRDLRGKKVRLRNGAVGVIPTDCDRQECPEGYVVYDYAYGDCLFDNVQHVWDDTRRNKFKSQVDITRIYS